MPVVRDRVNRSEPMPPEIEAKFRLDDPAALRARLRASGAACESRVLEVNRLFDAPDQRLRRAGCGLRLRTWRSLDDARRGATLTFKGPRAPGRLKVREELETALSAPDALAAVLEQLGYHETLVFEKRRETWCLEACCVTLDELPGLGWYTEIEGPSLEAVAAVRSRLGLDGSPPVDETYPELAERHAGAGAAGVRRLCFAG